MNQPKDIIAILDKLPWEDVVKSSHEEYYVYSDRYRGMAAEAAEVKEELLADAYTILARLWVADIYHVEAVPRKRKADAFSFPFSLTDKEITVATALMSKAEADESIARIGDILWIRKKNAQASKLAASAYVKCARATEDPVDWHHCGDRYCRSLKLAAVVDRKGSTFQESVTAIEECLERLKGEDPSLLTLRLVSALSKSEAGDPRRMAELLEHRGSLGDESLFSREELNAQHLEAAARLYRSAGDEDASNRCIIKAATALEEHAALFMKMPGNRMAGVHWLHEAYKRWERIPAAHDEAVRVHKKILEWEKIGMGDMVTHTQSVTFELELIRQLESVATGSFPESVFRFASLGLLMPDATPRAFAEQEAKSPLFSIMPPSWLRSDGKLDERLEGIPIGGEVPEAILSQLSFHYARTCWQMHGSLVATALNAVRGRFPADQMDLSWLTQISGFIPEDRQYSFKLGLEAGFRGNFLSATHLLVPQIENSLRQLLTSLGEITSFLSPDGTQDEHLLTKLLDNPKLKAYLGDDIGVQPTRPPH